jgi:SAM-dependent methyltransferase
MTGNVSSTPVNLRPQAFAGTAPFYLRYRPAYPTALIETIVAAAPGRNAALDLACGPGRVTLRIASVFDRLRAIDQEPEMIAAGEGEAARRGIGNITWAVGRAEELDVAPASIDLITIGDAFHRLDQAAILAAGLRWLKPGGCLATLGGADMLYGFGAWQIIVRDIVRNATRHVFPGGWAPSRPGAAVMPVEIEQRMRDAGYVDVAAHTVIEPYVWTIEKIAGYLQSTSICSRNVLGDHLEGFLAELEATLLAHDSSGLYREDISFGCTIARKPA